VLDFAFAQILQVRPTLAVLLEVLGYTLRKKDCPAPPQAITRCAMLIPPPARLFRQCLNG
jgi:hypothetical protein